MKVEFQTVDVFTDRQFGGNPVAVIPDARGLSEAQMQAIANEFNLAETTFVLPPDDPTNIARVCIFTPRAEMPFAGHPATDGHQSNLSDAGMSIVKAGSKSDVSSTCPRALQTILVPPTM